MPTPAITLRNLPQALYRAIRRRARERKISLNRAVIELIEGRVGGGTRPIHDDLDFLIGSWTDAEADAFDADLAQQRTIDPELWK